MSEREAVQEQKSLIAEATSALARLDADRLEKMVHSYEALNCGLFVLEPEKAAREMAVFARVLDATRVNMNVLSRLHEIGSPALEYQREPEQSWIVTESPNGHD
jgi:hypothetical protein